MSYLIEESSLIEQALRPSALEIGQGYRRSHFGDAKTPSATKQDLQMNSKKQKQCDKRNSFVSNLLFTNQITQTRKNVEGPLPCSYCSGGILPIRLVRKQQANRPK